MPPFEPPRCPNTDCPLHTDPVPGFFKRKGRYWPKCRSVPVPRFICRGCGKGFSRQTFRMDYRDRKPELNPKLFMLLVSGVGLRQAARVLEMTPRNTRAKFRKIGRHLRLQNRNMERPLPADAELQLDEIETYETCRNTMPLTLALLIELKSRLLVGHRTAPIRPSGKMTEQRLARIARHEQRYGKRQSRSRAAVRAVLRRAGRLSENMTVVELSSDEKTTYPSLAEEVFGDRLRHSTSPSRLVRATWNPLFPINHYEAVARDLTGRLRRDSWLASKLRWFLTLQMELLMAYRNWVRPRFNHDKETPAMVLGFVGRPLEPAELLAWRQDWGHLSIDVLAGCGGLPAGAAA